MKRIISIALAILMVVTLVAPLNAQNSFGKVIGSNGNERPVKDNYLEDEEVEEQERDYIFVLDDNPDFSYDFYQESNSGFKTLSRSLSNDLFSEVNEREMEQEAVKEKIKNLLGKKSFNTFSLQSVSNNASNQSERSFKVLFSGFTMSLKPSEMEFVKENISEIEKVYIDYKYDRPVYNVSPSMYHTNEMIHSQFAWNNGYKGEGRVVAVIDSGADVNHPAMRVSDESKVALTKEKIDKLIKENLLKGQYLNVKFPYGYNFYDHDMFLKDTNSDLGMHGMHVSGTVAANATQEEADKFSKGNRVMGVAPEAQILAMRVFGEKEAQTNTSAYLEALEESIVLGADSANMSLGSISGAEEGIDLAMRDTLTRAREAGMIVAIAAGNDFYQTFEHGNPAANNPDWGVMGTPAVYKDSLAVANFNNDKAFVNNTVIVDEKEFVAVPNDTIKKAKDTGFDPTKEYELVDVGLGNTAEDYAGKDVKGKIVLAQRGAGTFADKMKLAGEMGAIAFLLGNNEKDKPDYFIVMQTQTEGLIPGYSVTYRTYQIIKTWLENNSAGKIRINTDPHTIDNPNAKKMNDSSSWGPNPNLRLKPEISAPGGSIYSTVNVDNGRYQDMTGTSMATPHVAGAIAIMNQFYAQQGFNLERANKYDTIKNSLMVSTDPIKYPGTELYYSPRIQGAGFMNLQDATNPNLVTIVDSSSRMSNNYAKVEFGSIDNGVLDFNFTINNSSDKSVTYNVSYIVQTDKIKDGKVSFEPKLVKKGKFTTETVTVAAGQEATFTGSVDVSSEIANEDQVQPNGFFLDGFVFFEAVANDEGAKEFADLSVPFLAFKGDWNNLPIIDILPDQMFKEVEGEKVWDKTPIWYGDKKVEEFPGQFIEDWKFTHFYSRQSNGNRAIQGARGYDSSYIEQFAISPNNDGNKDDLSFRGVFLRNFKDLKFEFLDGSEKVLKAIVDPYNGSGRKSSYKSMYNESSIFTWYGKDADNNELPDGKYKVKVSVKTIDGLGSQEFTREIIIDRVKPEISNVNYEVLKDQEIEILVGEDGKELETPIKKTVDQLKITFDSKDDASGVNWTDVFRNGIAYDMLQNYEFNAEYDETKNVVKTTCVLNIINPEFNIDNAKNLIWVAVEDMAGNFYEETLNPIKGEGKIVFEKVLVNEDGQEIDGPTPQLDPYLEYLVEDTNKWVGVNSNDNLAYGKYHIFYEDAFPGYIYSFEGLDAEHGAVLLDENNPTVTITVKFRKVDDSKFATLQVFVEDADKFQGTLRLFAVANYGQPNETSYEIPKKESYNVNAYEVKLPAGEYKIFTNRIGDAKLAKEFKTVVLEENAITEVYNRIILYPNYYIQLWFGSNTLQVKDLFGTDFVEEKNEQGEDVKYITNFDKYFEVTDSSGNKMNITKANVKKSYFEESYNEYLFVLNTGSGKYTVKPLFDVNKYATSTAQVSLDTAEKYTDYIAIEVQSIDRGSITIHSDVFTNKEEQQPRFVYELYDARNEFVENWTDLVPGTYYLRARAQGVFRPEKEEYEINITSDNLNQSLTVRWFNITEETRKNPVLELAISGVDINSYGKNVAVTLTPINGGNNTTVTLTPGQLSQTLIPMGEYKFTTDLEDGWSYIFFTQRGKGGDKTQGYDDRIIINESYNYLELLIMKGGKKPDTTEYRVNITETGLEGSPIIEYVLYNDDVNYRTDKKEFINLQPGKYSLEVLNTPAGYVAVPRDYAVELTEDIKSQTVVVNFHKVNPNVKFINKIVDKDGNELTDADPINVQYQAAYTDPSTKKISYFREGEFPVGLELEVYPVNVKAPYKLKGGAQKVTLGNAEKTLTFEYIVDEKRVVLTELQKAIDEANWVLNNLSDIITKTYAKELHELLNEVDDYVKSDGITQLGVNAKTNQVWDKLDNIVWDTQIIKDAVKKAEAYRDYYYTDESFAKLSEAIKNAEDVLTLDNNKLNENIIRNAAKQIEDAINGLKDRPISGSFFEPSPDYLTKRDDKKAEPKKEEPKKEVVEEKKDYGVEIPEMITPLVFDDVADEQKEVVDFVTEYQIMKGTDEGKFRPNDPISRAMVVETLKRIAKDKSISASVKFNDVGINDWYTDSVKWAATHGYVLGDDKGNFNPNTLLTRQELALILARFLKMNEITLDKIKEFTSSDAASIPSWSIEAVKAMAENGLVEPSNENSYNPTSNVTRYELARALKLMIEWVQRQN